MIGDALSLLARANLAGSVAIAAVALLRRPVWAAQPLRGRVVAAPDWSSLPNGADFSRLYPRKASALGLEGLAVMRCRVGRTGGLSTCRVVREAPGGAGFGGAALQMAPRFRMKPKTVDGAPVAGGVVMIPVKFKLHP